MGNRRAERGAVTAELAMGIPVLLGVVLGLVWLLSVGIAQLRVTDAARETARAVARGDSVAAAVALGARVAPPGSTITVHAGDEQVVVTARGEVAGPGGWLGSIPGARVAAEAVAATEDVP